MASDDDVLLAVCGTTYRRVMDASGGDVEMVQLALPQDVRRAGFEADGDSPEKTFGQSHTLVTLSDGRTVCRSKTGRWTIEGAGP